MSYMIAIDGLDIVCDEPAEAIALAKYIATQRDGGCRDTRARGAQMSRILRNQRDREAHELGYIDLGGEAGGA